MDEQNAQSSPQTIAQAAERIGVTPASVRRFCWDGAFPNAYRTSEGGHWRIPAADVEAYIRQRQGVTP